MNHVGLQHVTISEYHDMLAHNCSMMLIMYKQKIFAWEWYGCGLSAFDCPAPPLVTANSQTKIIGAKAAFIHLTRKLSSKFWPRELVIFLSS
jgi:hypothetical protein